MFPSYLWPDQNFETLFITWYLDQHPALDIICDGLAFVTHAKPSKAKPYLWPKWPKLDTPFMTKLAEKPYPLGLHIPIKPT